MQPGLGVLGLIHKQLTQCPHILNWLYSLDLRYNSWNTIAIVHLKAPTFTNNFILQGPRWPGENKYTAGQKTNLKAVLKVKRKNFCPGIKSSLAPASQRHQLMTGNRKAQENLPWDFMCTLWAQEVPCISGIVLRDSHMHCNCCKCMLGPEVAWERLSRQLKVWCGVRQGRRIKVLREQATAVLGTRRWCSCKLEQWIWQRADYSKTSTSRGNITHLQAHHGHCANSHCTTAKYPMQRPQSLLRECPRVTMKFLWDPIKMKCILYKLLSVWETADFSFSSWSYLQGSEFSLSVINFPIKVSAC